jgi:hypothetical protein
VAKTAVVVCEPTVLIDLLHRRLIAVAYALGHGASLVSVVFPPWVTTSRATPSQAIDASDVLG